MSPLIQVEAQIAEMSSSLMASAAICGGILHNCRHTGSCLQGSLNQHGPPPAQPVSQHQDASLANCLSGVNPAEISTSYTFQDFCES